MWVLLHLALGFNAASQPGVSLQFIKAYDTKAECEYWRDFATSGAPNRFYSCMAPGMINQYLYTKGGK